MLVYFRKDVFGNCCKINDCKISKCNNYKFSNYNIIIDCKKFVKFVKLVNPFYNNCLKRSRGYIRIPIDSENNSEFSENYESDSEIDDIESQKNKKNYKEIEITNLTDLF